METETERAAKKKESCMGLYCLNFRSIFSNFDYFPIIGLEKSTLKVVWPKA